MKYINKINAQLVAHCFFAFGKVQYLNYDRPSKKKHNKNK